MCLAAQSYFLGELFYLEGGIVRIVLDFLHYLEAVCSRHDDI